MSTASGSVYSGAGLLMAAALVGADTQVAQTPNVGRPDEIGAFK